MSKKRKKRELTEDAAWEKALADHPKWRDALARDRLPDEIDGPDGQPMSPRMHLQIHTIIERQLAADEPKSVVAFAQQLKQLGVSRHDVRHEIARAVTGQMSYMLKESCPFDEARYFAELRQIVESHRYGDR